MTYHPHLHVVVPGGGVRGDGKTWLASRPDFLVPVKALSKIFRAKFRDEMRRAGLFDSIDSRVWEEAFVTDSRAVGDGESTLRYLARYVFRVAISNARILSLEKGRVRFRWKKSGSRRFRTMELDALEFLRRFLQHVLPPGFQKVRHYGFLSPHSTVSLDEVRQLVASAKNVMTAPETQARLPQADVNTGAATTRHPRCPHCGGRLHIVAIVFHRLAFQDSG